MFEKKDLLKWYDAGYCYVKEQTPEICFAALKLDLGPFKYVKEQTPEICIKLLEISPDNDSIS